MFHNNNGRASHGTFFKPCAQVPWPCAWAMAAMRVLHEQTLHQIEYLCIKCGRRGLFCVPRMPEVPSRRFRILNFEFLDCNGPFRFFLKLHLPPLIAHLPPARCRSSSSKRKGTSDRDAGAPVHYKQRRSCIVSQNANRSQTEEATRRTLVFYLRLVVTTAYCSRRKETPVCGASQREKKKLHGLLQRATVFLCTDNDVSLYGVHQRRCSSLRRAKQRCFSLRRVQTVLFRYVFNKKHCCSVTTVFRDSPNTIVSIPAYKTTMFGNGLSSMPCLVLVKQHCFDTRISNNNVL